MSTARPRRAQIVHRVGTIVHIHRDGEAFDVEFLALDGNTAAVATVPASRLRPVAATDLTHARSRGPTRSVTHRRRAGAAHDTVG